MAGIKGSSEGQVLSVRTSDDGKFLDLAVLQDGASDSAKGWLFADGVVDATELEAGQRIAFDFYASQKISKKGNPYFSVQFREVHQAGAKLRKAS